MNSQHPEKSTAAHPAEETVGKKFDDTVDPAVLEDISPHPPGGQVDRSIVTGRLVTDMAVWAVRLFVIGAFIYAVFKMAGNFWQGILPVLLALIICTVLSPVASAMRRHNINATLAAIITMLGFFGVLGGLVALIAPDFARQSQTLYLQTVEGIQRLQLWAQGPPLNLNPEDMSSYIDEVASWIQARAVSIAGSVFTGIGTATSIIVTLLIVVVLTFFFLKDGHRFLPWLRKATGRRTGWHLTEVLTRAWTTLGGFIRAQAMVAALDAMFIGIGLALIGVPLAMTLAIITFIAGFIPFVGAIVAGALSVTIALVSLGFTQAIMVLALVLIVQQLEGNVLSPWLQSKAMNLHPVIVLISVTVGGALFNLVGAFLAVPATSMIAVAYRYIQDMLQLESGEKTVDDVEFATVAGRLVGKYTQDRYVERRRQLAAEEGAAPHATSDSGELDLDSAPTAPESSGEGAQDRVAVREAIEILRGAFEHVLGKDKSK